MAETIVIRNRHLINLFNGLKALDGIAKSKDEFLHFDFENDIGWNIAKDMKIVERHIDTYNEFIRAENKRHDVKPGQALTMEVANRSADAQEAIEAIKDKEVKIEGLLFFTLDELRKRPDRVDIKLKINPIPPSVLMGLAPIIKDQA